MKNVILCIPADSWETLRETLELDARSKAFDKETRNAIATALRKVSHIDDHVRQLIAQYDISGEGIGEEILSLQVVTGLIPEKDADDETDDDDPPWRDCQ
jgi:hypothetical protein